MKKSSLLLGFGAAASLLVTPMIAGGCRTTQGAKGMETGEKSCGCKGEGKCEGKCGHKCEGKCGDKMKKEGKCGAEGSCGEGSCGSNK